jgi:hypothetical protein
LNLEQKEGDNGEVMWLREQEERGEEAEEGVEVTPSEASAFNLFLRKTLGPPRSIGTGPSIVPGASFPPATEDTPKGIAHRELTGPEGEVIDVNLREEKRLGLAIGLRAVMILTGL